MKDKITNYDIIREYKNIQANHSINTLISRRSKEDFHQFINGFYQAEGTTGAYFSKENSLAIRFYFSIGQNYSSEALNILLDLQKVLSVGKVKLEFNSKDKPHIRYVVSNTKDIIFKVLPYFSLLYGQKRRDLIILEKIYKLSLELLLKKGAEPELASHIDFRVIQSEFIHLVYSTNPLGQKRKLSLQEKLSMFNCNDLIYKEDIEVLDNNNLPSKLFIIGLFLGDGSFGFVFDAKPSREPIFNVKIVFNFAAQSNTEANISLLQLVAKSMNINPYICIRKDGMIGLNYTGKIVYEYIMPFLAEHEDWLFWRKPQLINAQKIVIIFKNKGHLTKNGLKAIVNLLYGMPNKYQKPKEFWLDLIDKRYWK
jgi:LAGLIDADG endonuclease